MPEPSSQTVTSQIGRRTGAGDDTLATWLERAARPEGRGSERGLRFLDRRERARFVPWTGVHAAASATALALRATGLRPGDRVGLIYPTGEEFFSAFFGILLAGAVPAPLYPPVRLGRLDEYHRRTAAMLRSVGARLVLADGRVRRLLGETMAAARPELGCRTLAGLSSARSPEPVHRPVPDDLALIQFSSGTTVEPKPVALSHRAVVAQTRILSGFWPDTERVSHSGVSWLPLYHDMGLIGCVFPALERVADLTLIGPEVFVARPAVWLRALSRYRGTISPAPNFAYGLCVAKVRDDELVGVDLSCWHAALNGAESVAPATLRAFIDRFSLYGFRPEALTPVYGLSEASLAVTFAPLEKRFTAEPFDRRSLEPGRRARPVGPARSAEPVRPPDGGTEAPDGTDGEETADAVRELVSVGLPVPGFEVEIRAPEQEGEGGDGPGAPLEEGRVGRVWVRGPSLMEGYFGRPEESAAALVDGWLDTGDLGFLRGGELFLTGRAKDLVIVRGKNVAPEEIERLALTAPGARAGCAVAVSRVPPESPGRSGSSDSEELVIFVEHARDAGDEAREALPDRVARAVLSGLGLAPDRIEVLAPGTLPRTSSGKLRRAEALRRWSEGTLDPPSPVSPARIAAALLRSGVAFFRPGPGEDA